MNDNSTGTTTWPDLAISPYDKLTGRNAETTYGFNNLGVSVPSSASEGDPQTEWKLNGIGKKSHVRASAHAPSVHLGNHPLGAPQDAHEPGHRASKRARHHHHVPPGVPCLAVGLPPPSRRSARVPRKNRSRHRRPLPLPAGR